MTLGDILKVSLSTHVLISKCELIDIGFYGNFKGLL